VGVDVTGPIVRNPLVRTPRAAGSGGSREVTIESLAATGEGVARERDGRVLFVPFAAPGDRVRVRVVEERRRFARARLEEVIRAGAARTEPVCPVFGRCGGCAWQHVSYPAQLAAKAGILRDALVRLGGLEVPGEIEFVPSPRPYGYRARARLVVSGGAIGYRHRRSHVPCPVRSCPLLVPPLERLLGELAARPLAPDGDWELAAGAGEVARAVPLPPPPAVTERLPVRVGEELLGVSPGVFVQANALLRETLARDVLELAGSGDTAFDLFAGAGFFTLPLARRWRRVLAVESDARAAGDLRHNLASAGITNVSVDAAPVERALRRAAVRRLEPDLVLLDPPRAGLARGAASALAALPASRVIYVSCDPATLARDLAGLVRGGLRLARVRGFDLFPQTPHVEAVAVLERGEA
jgi:23S rRNA (uracil1939-C5)-methyltransferase